MGIYVDDVLVVGSDAILTEMMERLSTIFQMAPYDKVTREQPVTFCGYEIYKEEKGYGLRQEKYIQELLSRRAVEGKEGQPLPKIVEGEDEEHHELWVVREVQAIVGELQWLATRTRPDLSYATAFVARILCTIFVHVVSGLCSQALPLHAAVFGEVSQDGTVLWRG